MEIIVQKFGGTSVASADSREEVLKKIIDRKEQGKAVVVVVSAIGRLGEPYATDTLIDLLGDAKASEREMDLLLSCGEIVSGVVLTSLLQSRGHKARFLTGWQAGILTDETFGSARIIRVFPDAISKYLEEGFVVVVAGFQGVTESGEVTTLGRGGSDTTASVLGVALQAELVEIYTDVDGVKTADPRLVEDARTLEEVTYNEICQFASEGARVIHPRAVEAAMEGDVPINVRCTFSAAQGTLIRSVVRTGDKKGTTIGEGRLITGVTQISNISQIRVRTRTPDEVQKRQEFLLILAQQGISIDFINVAEETTSFTVPDALADRVLGIAGQSGLEASAYPGCAKVAVVGAGMTGVPGVMARVVKALTQENIRILQSADSYTTIWCLVDMVDLQRAAQALHCEFALA